MSIKTPYLNTFKAPAEKPLPENVHLNTKLEDYDFNFAFPVKALTQNGIGVELRPFVPSLYASATYDAVKDRLDLFDYMPNLPWKSVSDTCAWVEEDERSSSSSILYAIFDKTKPAPEDRKDDLINWPGQLGGIVTYGKMDPSNLTGEIGYVIIFPSSQRTHVLTHSVWLMLNQAFSLPSSGGFGMRRIQWIAFALNQASRKAALRLGLNFEGIVKQARLLPPGKIGSWPGREGDGKFPGPSRDWALFAITYDEWNGGKKEKLWDMVQRK